MVCLRRRLAAFVFGRAAWALQTNGVERSEKHCCPAGATVLQGFLLRPYMRPPRHPVQPYEGVLARKLTGLVSGKGEDLLLQAPSEDVQRYHRLRASIQLNCGNGAL